MLLELYGIEIDQEWRGKAICGGLDPEIFFPGKGEDLEPAKRVCRQCPVQTDCLEYALSRPEKMGVWGGASERERRRIIKKRTTTRRERQGV